jgi:hypothetical protein
MTPARRYNVQIENIEFNLTLALECCVADPKLMELVKFKLDKMLNDLKMPEGSHEV